MTTPKVYVFVAVGCAVLYLTCRYLSQNSIVSMLGLEELPDEKLQIDKGRHESDFPSPRCCEDIGCLLPRPRTAAGSAGVATTATDKAQAMPAQVRPRNVILTTLRTASYLPMLKLFVCSVRKSNPEMEVAVATVEGDLTSATMAELRALKVTVVIWEEFKVGNAKHARYALNWVKLRAWDMVQYDAILMLDADTFVVGDVQRVFDTPAAFACVLDEDKVGLDHSSLGRMQGGVVLLRPCPAVGAHMRELVNRYPELHFSHAWAEQSFLDWYFHYDRSTLPVAFNAMSHYLDDQLLTRGGQKAHIVHFTRFKYNVTRDGKLRTVSQFDKLVRHATGC